MGWTGAGVPPGKTSATIPGDRSPTRYGPFAIATLTMAMVAWPIAFNLGAYGEVFYDDVFAFVVAATVGLAISVITPPYTGPKMWLARAALASPAAWLGLSVIFFDSTAASATHPVFGFLGLAAVIVSVPTVIKMLTDMFVPQLVELDNTRLVISAVAVVAAVAVTGLAVGANNDAFLQCEDFKVAGADEPANCAP